MAVNMGALFAGVTADKRMKVAKGKAAAHIERIGILLTRLFVHLGLDLDTYTCNPETEFMDTQFLIHCEILQDATTYRFTSRGRSVQFCSLPQPSLIELEVAANVGVTPRIEYLCSTTGAPTGSTPKPRKSTSTTRPAPAPALAPDVSLSHEEAEDLEANTQRTQQSRSYYRQPYASELMLGDISDNPGNAKYRRWMVASTKRVASPDSAHAPEGMHQFTCY